jgi:hypothetical protein
VLKATPDLQVRIAILKGQQLVAQGDLTGALAEYQKALEANPQSSLASYRIGELLFTQRNYQASVNSYRDALRGDGEPRWTEVWSHIALGKIFDITGQRDRAVNEYRLAVQTNDNTQGAVNEARQWLQKPYKLPDTRRRYSRSGNLRIRMNRRSGNRCKDGDQRTCGSTDKNANPERGFDARVARIGSNHHPPILLNWYPEEVSNEQDPFRNSYCLMCDIRSRSRGLGTTACGASARSSCPALGHEDLLVQCRRGDSGLFPSPFSGDPSPRLQPVLCRTQGQWAIPAGGRSVRGRPGAGAATHGSVGSTRSMETEQGEWRVGPGADVQAGGLRPQDAPTFSGL